MMQKEEVCWAEVVHDGLIHCYNDRGCVSCPMYDKCEGDAGRIIGIAADTIGLFVHYEKTRRMVKKDLISREAVLREARLIADYDTKDENGVCLRVNAVEVAAIKKVNSADDEYVRNGRWLGKHGDYTCSECGCEAPNDGFWGSDYCPQCGVKMGGERM